MPVPPGNLCNLCNEAAAPAKQGSLNNWQISRRAVIRDMRMAFKIPYVYDYVTKFFRQQTRHSKL
jgi:hypothetical protein